MTHRDASRTIGRDRRGLIAAGAALALGLPGPAQATGFWTQTPAAGMGDVSVVPGGRRAWLAGRNGTVWRTDDGVSFTQVSGAGMKRIAAERDPEICWAVGANGLLWKQDRGRWIETKGTGMADVAVGPDGKIWVAGLNGTVWFTSGTGQSFGQIRGGEGFARLATLANGNLMLVGGNGTVWHLDPSQTRWTQTRAQGMGDVATGGPDSKVWLAGRNGSVWWTHVGDTFTQIEGSGFESLSVQSEGTIWAVGSNGTLWTWKG